MDDSHHQGDEAKRFLNELIHTASALKTKPTRPKHSAAELHHVVRLNVKRHHGLPSSNDGRYAPTPILGYHITELLFYCKKIAKTESRLWGEKVTAKMVGHRLCDHMGVTSFTCRKISERLGLLNEEDYPKIRFDLEKRLAELGSFFVNQSDEADIKKPK